MVNKTPVQENAPRENQSKSITVNDHIQEFENMLSICNQRIRQKSSDRLAREDANALYNFLAELKKAEQEGKGKLPILRWPWEWDAIDRMRERVSSYGLEKKTTDNSPISEENFKRLDLLDRYKAKPRSVKEEEEARNNLMNLANNGKHTFIAYEDLEKIAKSGRPFFLPPNSAEDNACLSCGNGNFYKGPLSKIRMELEADLKKTTDNKQREQIETGLRRIDSEIIMKPPQKGNTPDNEKDPAPQENTYTNTTPRPNPFRKKPFPS